MLAMVRRACSDITKQSSGCAYHGQACMQCQGEAVERACYAGFLPKTAHAIERGFGWQKLLRSRTARTRANHSGTNRLPRLLLQHRPGRRAGGGVLPPSKALGFLKLVAFRPPSVQATWRIIRNAAVDLGLHLIHLML